jgi:hypothetical protein
MEYNVRADMYLIVGSVTCMQYDGKLRPAIKHALSRAANGLQNICIVATCIDVSNICHLLSRIADAHRIAPMKQLNRSSKSPRTPISCRSETKGRLPSP